MEIQRHMKGALDYNERSRDLVKIYNRKGEEMIVHIPNDQTSGHGGADGRLRDMLFRGMENDPLNQKAGIRAGMMSIGIGMAANISMKENRRVDLKEFELKENA